MRINESGIMFRNEVNLLNPLEVCKWILTTDWIKGFVLKVDGIKIESDYDFKKLNKSQIEKVEKFLNKNKDNLPVGVNEMIKYAIQEFAFSESSETEVNKK